MTGEGQALVLSVRMYDGEVGEGVTGGKTDLVFGSVLIL